jgi:hypothetical protein
VDRAHQPLHIAPSGLRPEQDGFQYDRLRAHRRIEHWLAQSRHSDRNDHVATVALLRAIYDMVDRVKTWEAERGVDGAHAFATRCAELGRAYDELETRLDVPTRMRGSRLRRLIGWWRC